MSSGFSYSAILATSLHVFLFSGVFPCMCVYVQNISAGSLLGKCVWIIISGLDYIKMLT